MTNNELFELLKLQLKQLSNLIEKLDFDKAKTHYVYNSSEIAYRSDIKNKMKNLRTQMLEVEKALYADVDGQDKVMKR